MRNFFIFKICNRVCFLCSSPPLSPCKLSSVVSCIIRVCVCVSVCVGVSVCFPPKNENLAAIPQHFIAPPSHKPHLPLPHLKNFPLPLLSSTELYCRCLWISHNKYIPLVDPRGAWDPSPPPGQIFFHFHAVFEEN